jgi:O-antigen ligase
VRAIHAIIGLFFLFFLWNALSLFWSKDPYATIQQAQTFFQYLAMIIVVWDLYRTEAALQAGMQAFVLGAYVAVFSIGSSYLSGSQDLSRFTGTGFNPNIVSFILALAIPMAWFLATQERDRKAVWRPVNVIYIPLALVAIALTGSRAAAIALVPVLMYMMFSPSKYPIRVRILGLGIVGLVIAVISMFVPERPIDRILSTGDASASVLSQRFDIWSDGWNVFTAHPLIGVGADGFRSTTDKGAHNFLISSLAETGIIGFGLFAAILVAVTLEALRSPREYRAVWMTLLAVWVIVASTHDLEVRKATWLVFSLVLVSGALARRSVASDDRSPGNTNAASRPQDQTHFADPPSSMTFTEGHQD